MDEHSVEAGKELAGATTESPLTALATSRQWIEKRYGAITIQNHSVMFQDCLVCVVTASVAVWKGVSVGVGATEGDAIYALWGDLSGEIRNTMERANASVL